MIAPIRTAASSAAEHAAIAHEEAEKARDLVAATVGCPAARILRIFRREEMSGRNAADRIWNEDFSRPSALLVGHGAASARLLPLRATLRAACGSPSRFGRLSRLESKKN